MQAFSALAASRDGALDKRTKELIALAIGIAAHCDGCIGFHTEALVGVGATRQEVEEALGVAIYMGARRSCTPRTRSRHSSNTGSRSRFQPEHRANLLALDLHQLVARTRIRVRHSHLGSADDLQLVNLSVSIVSAFPQYST
jgi:AhpD family alkylhydroperoxidase